VIDFKFDGDRMFYDEWMKFNNLKAKDGDKPGIFHRNRGDLTKVKTQ